MPQAQESPSLPAPGPRNLEEEPTPEPQPSIQASSLPPPTGLCQVSPSNTSARRGSRLSAWPQPNTASRPQNESFLN